MECMSVFVACRFEILRVAGNSHTKLNCSVSKVDWHLHSFCHETFWLSLSLSDLLHDTSLRCVLIFTDSTLAAWWIFLTAFYGFLMAQINYREINTTKRASFSIASFFAHYCLLNGAISVFYNLKVILLKERKKCRKCDLSTSITSY